MRGFEAGAVDFVSKPFQGEEIVARVRTHLTIQRLHRPQVEAGSHAATLAAYSRSARRAQIGELAAREPVFRAGEVVAFRFRIVRYLAKAGWASSTRPRISSCTNASRSKPS